MADAMNKVRIADLPDTSSIDPESYVIIERPGIGKGTFKSTVGDLQQAITVSAEVIKRNHLVDIRIQDINGETNASITEPTASIHDNGDGTATITITDFSGQTTSTVVSSIAIDLQPTQGSSNFVTSGTIYDVQQSILNRISPIEQHMATVDSTLTTHTNRLDELYTQISSLGSAVSNLGTLVDYLNNHAIVDTHSNS